MKKIAIIGAGNMGGAIFEALHDSRFHHELYLADIDFKKLQLLAQKISLNDFEKKFSTSPIEVIKKSEIIILAIKPQIFEKFAQSIKIDVSQKTFISIMAGVKIDKIKQNLSSQKIIRTMPNLPAQAKKGLTGFFSSKEISLPEKKIIIEILETFSQVVEVKAENFLDKITALSGSGPAYFFHLTKVLYQKALDFGFDQLNAKKIAESTFIGSATILKNNQLSAQEWEKAVCSKGGTTEKALEFLAENNFDQIFQKAIEKAKDRSEQLSA